MIWLAAAVVVACVAGIVGVYVFDLHREHQQTTVPFELAHGNLRVRRRMANLARLDRQAGVVRAEHTFGWVWVFVPRRRRSNRYGDPGERVGWAFTRRGARRQLAAAQQDRSRDDLSSS